MAGKLRSKFQQSLPDSYRRAVTVAARRAEVGEAEVVAEFPQHADSQSWRVVERFEELVAWQHGHPARFHGCGAGGPAPTIDSGELAERLAWHFDAEEQIVPGWRHDSELDPAVDAGIDSGARVAFTEEHLAGAQIDPFATGEDKLAK